MYTSNHSMSGPRHLCWHAGLLTILAYTALVLGGKLHAATALAMFVSTSLASALADVTIDAMVAMKSRDKPELATHIQSLCNASYGIGGLSGYLLSGLAVHVFGAQVCNGKSLFVFHRR